MDEIDKLRAEIGELRAEFSAHVVALDSWLIACAACLLSGAVVAAMVH